MTDIVTKAREFAVHAHGDQRYGTRPYAFHLDAVAMILEPYGITAQIVGYLHDTLEDTATAHDEIASGFGTFVAACVAILTDEPGPDRKTRKTLTYAKMSTVVGEHELALIVKAADRLANIRACVADANASKLETYANEHEALRNAAYRPGACDPLWQEMDVLLAK